MRMSTIWDPSFPMDFKERLNRTRELAELVIADHFPKRLAFRIAYSQIGKATMKSAHVPATPLDVVLENIHRIREGLPVKEWKPDHDTWYYHADTPEDHEHVHVAPLDLDKMTPEEREQLAPALKGLLGGTEAANVVSEEPSGVRGEAVDG
jgi:hypothetical protein